jgi:hypothetical protein
MLLILESSGGVGHAPGCDPFDRMLAVADVGDLVMAPFLVNHLWR